MTFSSRSRIVFGGGPSPPTSTVPGTSRAPVSSSISCVETAWPHIVISGARPFSKRAEASVRRLSRCDVRCRFGPFQLAASISTRVVVGWTSERWPPMMPGDRRRAVVVADQAHVGVQRALGVVERDHLLAVARPADHEVPAGDEVPVERVQRLAGQQHHVVGDVDDVVDRALAGGHQARLQPRRRRADRDVLEQPRGEARAQVRAPRPRCSRPRPARACPGSSSHGGGFSGAPVAACTSRAAP